jgi:iron(III) transport system permease protein
MIQHRSLFGNGKIRLGALLVEMALAYLIVTFILYPNFNLLVSVFYKKGTFSLDVFHKIAKSPRAMRSMLNSFILAISMVFSVNVVGTLCVLFTEYWKIKGEKILRLAYMSPLVYGGVTLVTGYKFIYGSNGILTHELLKLFPSLNPNWFTGYRAVIFIMTFACTSNHMIFLANAVRGIDGHVIEAARNMGASGRKIFFEVVLPMLKPTFFALTILTFLTGLSAMSAPLIVGGADFQTINPMIITFAKSPYSREIAALLAVILGAATILLLTILNKIERGGNYISVSKTKTRLAKQRINSPAANALAHVIAYIMCLIYITPITLVILFSFCDALAIKTAKFSWSSFSLDSYKALFTQSNAFKPYLVSIAYSIAAAAIVVVISIVVARIVSKSKSKAGAFFEYSVLVPWLLPHTLIALGLMLTYDVPRIIIGNRILIGTLAIMLVAYVVVKLPFSFRMIKAAFYSVDDNLEEAAKCMGAGTFRTMIKVIIPVIMPAVISVVVLNFNSLLSDYDLSVFLYHPLFQPLGIAIKEASDEAATTNAQAMAFVYSTFLMLISSIALYVTRGEGATKVKRLLPRKRRG